MERMEIRVERFIDAGPEVVWDVITDLDRAPETLAGVDSIERLAGEGYAPGVKWRETRTMFGKQATEDMWVDVAERPRRTVVRAASRGMEYDSTYTLTPEAGGTRLALVFGGESGEQGLLARVAMKVLGPIGKVASRKALEKDMADIARAAEARRV